MLVDDIVTALSNAAYWTAQAYGGAVQPTLIKKIDGLTTKTKKKRGHLIYVAPGLNDNPLETSRPTENATEFYTEEAIIILHALKQSELKTMLTTVRRILLKYLPWAFITAVPLDEVLNGQVNKQYIYIQTPSTVEVV